MKKNNAVKLQAKIRISFYKHNVKVKKPIKRAHPV